MREEDVIVLLSNANSDICENTRSTFSNELPRDSVGPGNWEVGIDYLHMDNFFTHIPHNVLIEEFSVLIIHITSGRVFGTISFNDHNYIVTNEQLLNVMRHQTVGIDWSRSTTKLNLTHYNINDGMGLTNGFIFTPAGDLFEPEDDAFGLAMSRNVIDWLNAGDSVENLIQRINYGKQSFVRMKPDIVLSNKEYSRIWPASINISLDQICANMTSHGYSQVVKSIPFNDELRKKTAISKKFEKGEYFELKSGVPKYFKVSLTSEAGNPLHLATGQPTVLAIKLRPRMTKSFVINLSSDDNLKEFPTNSNSEFKATLPHPISLNDSWEVALSTIRYPTHINYSAKLNSTCNLLITYLSDGETTTLTFYFEGMSPAYTPVEFIYELNIRAVAVAKVYRYEFYPVFYYDEDTAEVTFSVVKIEGGEQLRLGVIGLSEKMSEFLGNENNKSDVDDGTGVAFSTFYKGGTIPIGHLHDSTLIPQSMLIYTNITKPIIVGGAYGKVVKVIPIRRDGAGTRLQDVHLYESQSLSFITASNSEVYTIDVRLTDIGGNAIQFHKSANSSINFIVRKKK